MSEIKDGGPAFPRHYGTSFSAERETSNWHGGMSLRDYFAAQYLAGRSARGEIESYPEAASAAYDMADAMLKARETT